MHVDSHNQVRARNSMLIKESLALRSKAQGVCDDLCRLGGDVREALVQLWVLRNEVDAAISDTQKPLLQGTFRELQGADRGINGDEAPEKQLPFTEASSKNGCLSPYDGQTQRPELVMTGDEPCVDRHCPGDISTVVDPKITDQLVEFRRIGFWTRIDSHDP